MAGVAVAGVAVATALLAVAGAAGAWSPLLDVPAHLAPLLLISGLATAAAAPLLVRRRRLILTASAIAVVSTAATIIPELHRSTGPDTATAAGQLKVIQFNAWKHNRSPQRAVRWLDAQDADVITISEARKDIRDDLLRRGWKVAGAKGTLMIFTRERYRRMVRLKLPGSELTWVNATYGFPVGNVEVVTTHFDWPTERASRNQPRDLNRVVQARPKNLMILTGDFNAAPWSARLRGLDRDLGLIRRDRALATFPAQIHAWAWPVPALPIDHVYAGPGWSTVSVERGPWLGSDHYPVIVTLAPASP